MIGKVFGDGERRDGEDLFFAHDAHGLVAELVGVVDGYDAGARGVERAGFAGGVDGDALAGARGFSTAALSSASVYWKGVERRPLASESAPVS